MQVKNKLKQDMKKENRYELISDYSYPHFMDSVNAWIEKGYQPLGGVNVVVLTLNEDMEYDPKGAPKAVYHQALFR